MNKHFMKEWIKNTEHDAAQRKQAEIKHKEEHVNLQQYLLQQMGVNRNESGVPEPTSMAKRKKVEGMSEEELRLNKNLLKEISQKKKENGLSQIAKDDIRSSY